MRISDWSSDVCSSDLASLLAEMMANISNHFDELVAILIAEGGRPRATAEWEIKWVLDQYVPSLLSRTLPDQSWDEAGIGKITKRHMPLGVVAAISPWNLPFLLSFVKILPALLTGNTVVLKPSPFTPLTVLRAADLMHTILPKGVLNVITGGDSLGPWLTTHPDIAKVRSEEHTSELQLLMRISYAVFCLKKKNNTKHKTKKIL